MKLILSGAVCSAVVAILSTVAFAQTTPQTPTGAAAATQQDQQVTVGGCVQREADYRRARDAGRGGVAGTGVGAGNEFILANATMSTGGSATTGTSGRTAGAARGTAGAASGAVAYELTGQNEGQVAQYVGRRVEISGRLKAAEATATGPTGGPTAGAPPRGIDIASQDLKLRELEVTTVRAAADGGTCPAQ